MVCGFGIFLEMIFFRSEVVFRNFVVLLFCCVYPVIV